MRQPLDLDLPERKIVLSDEGKVTSGAFAERFDAHRLIEEIHDARQCRRRRGAEPAQATAAAVPGPRGAGARRSSTRCARWRRPRASRWPRGRCCRPRISTALLAQAEGTEFDELINITTLRSMTQAYYSPENFGHFGLALKNYAHFTSPIRRYSDLIVHRALISAHGWGKDGLSARISTGSKRPRSRSPRPSAGRWRPSATPPTATSPPSCPSGSATSFPAGSRHRTVRRLREARRDRGRRADARSARWAPSISTTTARPRR